MNQKTIAPHVASALAVLTAVLSALHPGFTLNPAISQWATVTLLIGAAIVQAITTFFHVNNAGKLAVIKTLASKVVVDFKDGTTVVQSPKTP